MPGHKYKGYTNDGRPLKIAFDVDGVLSPCTIPMSEDGEPCRLLNVKDGYAIQLAVKKGLRLAIISGGRSKAVALRYRNLGVQDVYMGAQFKLPLFERWLDENGLDANEVIFVGDDIPDLHVMDAAGLSIAPADAAWQANLNAQCLIHNAQLVLTPS